MLGGVVRPLAGLRVVGAGMLRISRQGLAEPDDAAADVTERWSRTRGALGDDACRKIRLARVALIGVSRTGSMLAYELAALGVRGLTLVDPDRIEIHNLDAMLGVAEADVGQKKVAVLARRLAEFRGDLAIQGLDCDVTAPAVLDRVRSADLLVTCVDDDTPRLAVAMLAGRLLKPHLDIGTGVQRTVEGQTLLAGDVRLLLPRAGCVCCVGGLRDEARARHELSAAPGSLRARPALAWHQQRAGSLITINAMSVSVGVQLWLDLLAGQVASSHWTRLAWQPGRGCQIDEGPVGATRGCRICQAGADGDGNTLHD